MRDRPKPRLLTDAEIAEIRKGVESGLRGPIVVKWIEQLLADHGERVRLGPRDGEE